jgi:hypothetical protein
MLFCWSAGRAAVVDTGGFTVAIWSVPVNEMDSIGDHFDFVANCFEAQDAQSATAFLNACKARGLSGLPGVDCTKLTDAAALNSLVNGIKTHTSYAGLMLYDEPADPSQWCPGANAQQLQAAYTIIKNDDPVHPVFIDDWHTDLGTSNPMTADKAAYDFFTDDNYIIQTGATLADYRTVLNQYYSGAAPKAWLTLIQLHDMGGSEIFRMPTPLEERIITYMPVVAGTKGIMFYSFDSEAKAFANTTLWTYVKKLADELKTLKPVLAAPNLANAVTISPATAKVWAAVKKYQNDYYLVACNYAHTGTLDNTSGNPAPQAQSGIKFTITGLSSGSVVTIGSAGLGTSDAPGRSLTLSNGSFTDSFDPFAVNIYQITPGGSAVAYLGESHAAPFTVTLSPRTLTLGHLSAGAASHVVRAELLNCLGRSVWRSGVQYVPLHVQTVSWSFEREPRPGVYVLRLMIDDNESDRMRLTVN